MQPTQIRSVEDVLLRLREVDYIAGRDLATAVFLALRLQRPLLLEGEAGVGKTEAAKAVARMLDARLIRLQCYEGIDVGQAVYEWNYARQLLHVRAAAEGQVEEAEKAIFGGEYLLRRPVLEAIDNDDPVAPVLLVDEIDRADEEFEAFLLEVLSENQVSIPEYGTVRARVAPLVLLTSNRTREIHDGLKRRCLYHWIEYPALDVEVEIVRLRARSRDATLAAHVVAMVQELRTYDLYKRPGVAEAVDWADALAELGASARDAAAVESTLGVVLKNQEDVERVQARVPELVEVARRAGG